MAVHGLCAEQRIDDASSVASATAWNSGVVASPARLRAGCTATPGSRRLSGAVEKAIT